MLNFFKIQYPQKIFSLAINSSIKGKMENLSMDGTLNILDIPCGNGETSYDLSKLENTKVLGYDLSQELIDNAQRKYKSVNLEYRQGNIFNVLSSGSKNDVICVINSFFLLPDQDKLLSLLRNSVEKEGLIYFVIPNVKGVNYLVFKKGNPNVNLREFEIEEFNMYLEKMGLDVVEHKGLCHANVYGRKELRFLSRLGPYYLIILNYLMVLLKLGTPSYYLVMAKRK